MKKQEIVRIDGKVCQCSMELRKGLLGFILVLVHPLLESHIDFRKGELTMRKVLFFSAVIVFLGATLGFAADLGNLSSNPYDPNSTANPYGAGNPYNPNSITNPYGKYGNPYSPNSATNPYATETPRLYDSQGNYRGKLSTNPYDSDSISNPYGKYGNKYSPDSINNPFGAGNPYAPDSPNNPYGSGWRIIGK